MVFNVKVSKSAQHLGKLILVRMAAVYESILPKKIDEFLHQSLMAARAGEWQPELGKDL
jgi:hypothetical protein